MMVVVKDIYKLTNMIFDNWKDWQVKLAILSYFIILASLSIIVSFKILT